jgi:hypothetical protein
MECGAHLGPAVSIETSPLCHTHHHYRTNHLNHNVFT